MFRVDTDAGAYCVETDANLDITMPALNIVGFNDDKVTGRLSARKVLGNTVFTRIYHPVREFIK